MQRSFVVVVATMLLPGMGSAEPSGPTAPLECNYLQEFSKRLDSLERKAARLERLLSRKRGFKLGREMWLFAKELRVDIQDLLVKSTKRLHECIGAWEDQVHRTVRAKPELPPETRPRLSEPVPIGTKAFQALLKEIEQASFAKDKLSIVRTAASTNYFLVDHVRRILRLFSFARDRLEALRLLRDRILDRKNLFKIYSLFEYSVDKEAARRILERREPGKRGPIR